MKVYPILVSVCITFTAGEVISVSQGELPIVFAHPHDGTVYPAGWPDRTDGCIVPPSTNDCSWGGACLNRTLDSSNCAARTFRDSYTREVAQHAVEVLHNLTGAYPSIVVNHVHRSKLDANRDIAEATQDFEPAMQAWGDYHAAIGNLSSLAVGGRCNSALVLDMHGQAHLHGWVEVGYSLSSSKLGASDGDMAADPATYQDRSTVRHAARNAASTTVPYMFTSLLRDTPPATPGDPTLRVSLGGLLEDAGFDSVPSPEIPDPDGQSYFSGGYTSQRWSSRDAVIGSDLYRVDAIQVEMPRWIRFGNSSVQQSFGTALGHAVFQWVQHNHRIQLAGGNPCWAAAAPSASPLVSATPSSTPSATVSATPSATPSSTALPGSGNTGENNTQAEGLGTGAVAGITVGAVALVAGAAAAWYLGACRPRGGTAKVKQGSTAGGEYELPASGEQQSRLVSHTSPIHEDVA